MKKTSHRGRLQVEVQMPKALWKLLRSLETRCTADCCQLLAFEVETYLVQSWAESWGDADAAAAQGSLDALIQDVEDQESTVELVLTHVCYRGPRDELLRELRSWRAVIAEAREAAQMMARR